MAKEIRADPASLSDLADASLAAAAHVGDHFRAGYRHLPLPASTFGTAGDSAALDEAMTLLRSSATVAVADLAAVLEGDADRLLRTAFAYQDADRRADQRLGGSRGAAL